MWLKRKYFAWLIIIWLVAGWFVPLLALADCIPENQEGSLAGSQTCADKLCCPDLACQPFTKSILRGRDEEWDKTFFRCVKDTSSVGVEGPQEKTEVKFVPQITIPGSITIGGQPISFTKGMPVIINNDTIGQYLAVFYRFFVMAIAVMAVVMVMWGGFKRIYAAGSPERVKDANDTIVSAISGLAIALLSYTLLNLINPKLTEFQTLKVDKVTREELEWNAEAQLLSQPSPQLFNITPHPKLGIDSNVTKQLSMGAMVNLKIAMDILDSKGYGAFLTDAYRSPEEQKKIIKQNCQNPPGSETCNPYVNKPPTCIMRNGPYSCSHATGNAIDIWATKDGNGKENICIKPPEGNTRVGYCSGKGKSKCLENECQAALISAMKQAGFCNLCSEPWHFEYVRGDFKGSPGCTC